MRKIRKSTFIILVAMLYLTGCASDSSDKAMEIVATTTENVATEQNAGITENVSAEQNVEIIEEVLDNETMDAMEAEEESTPETVVEEELPIPFDFILNNIYDSLQLDPATDEINCVHFSTGIHEVVVSCDTADDRMKAIAYCVMDVNEDGVDELLIVDTVWPEPGNVRILDMYTLVEGTPVRVIEGWARNRFYLLDDGKIYCSGSGGAAYSNEELLEFAPDATVLTSTELYFTYPKDNDIEYYYNEEGIYDVSVATEISEDEFRTFADDCESRWVVFETKTFDLFK